MTCPRRLVPRQTHSVTRRTAQRTLFLLPTREVNEIVAYALGLAASRYDVSVHAYLAMANHPHCSITDAAPDSQLPDFFRDMNSLVARALNAHYGRGENLWSPGSYDNVEVHGGNETLEEQLLYIWTNPVSAGLVARPEDWPGVKLLPEDFGRTIVAERPEHAFFGGRRPAGFEPSHPPAHEALQAERRRRREEAQRRRRARERRKAKRKGRPTRRRTTTDQRRRKEPAQRPRRDRRTLPERVAFRVAPPPGYEHMSLEEVRAHFRALLDERIAKIHAERRAAGRTRFMGADAVLAQDPLDSAGSTSPTFARNPRIACRDPERRKAHLVGLQMWRGQYRGALLAWRDGDREVLFPLGSFALPRYHSARLVRATGPPSPA